MAYYWFAKNIPELQEVAVADRRQWLRVAEERSCSKRAATVSLVLVLLAVFVGIVSAGHWHPSALTVLACFLGAFVVDRFWNGYRQARARRWLREHLRESRADEPAASASQP